MPASAKNINAFDLKLLKSLINFKINRNYTTELSRDQKRSLCIRYDADGGIIKLSPDHFFKVWPENQEISFSISASTLSKLCKILKPDYEWNIYTKDISLFRPKEILTGVPYDELKRAQRNIINKKLENIFSKYTSFIAFEKAVILKLSDSLDGVQTSKTHDTTNSDTPKIDLQRLLSEISDLKTSLETRGAYAPQVFNSKYNVPTYNEVKLKVDILTINSSMEPTVLPESILRPLRIGNKFEVEKQLEIYYNQFKSEYIANGNPIAMYNKVSPFIFGIENRIPYKPVQIGKYHWFLSYLLINSDYSKEILSQARIHAEISISIFTNLDLFLSEINKLLVKAYWLRALTYKMEGQLNFAHKLLTDTINELEKEKLGGYFDNLYLHRQKVLIEDEEASFDLLFKRMEEYKDDPLESYYSGKRIFEFALKSDNKKKLDKLYKISRHYYQIVAPKLEQVYKFSYWKYLFIYFKAKKNDLLADRIYKYLIDGSIKKQLYGQQRSLIELHKKFND